MTSKQHNTWIEIDKSALLNNIAFFNKMIHPSRLCLVIKSNAYGHGLKVIYECLKNEPFHSLAIAYLDEAAKLRQLGFKGRILHLSTCFEYDYKRAADLDVEILITSMEHLDSWLSSKHQPKIHLKLDTGLHRQGINTTELNTLKKKLDKIPPKKLQGVCSHFADVEDQSESHYAQKQLAEFHKQLSTIKDKLPDHYETHFSASGAALLLENARFDFCRVGISLYGLWPSGLVKKSFLTNNNQDELQPVLSWHSKVHLIREIKLGDKVGYGCTFVAPGNMKIALIPVGYADGFSRQLQQSKAGVYIQNKFCQIVGRVSMNMCVVDVSQLDEIRIGDQVDIISKKNQSAETLAEYDNTIHYELLTRLPRHLPRIILN